MKNGLFTLGTLLTVVVSAHTQVAAASSGEPDGPVPLSCVSQGGDCHKESCCAGLLCVDDGMGNRQCIYNTTRSPGGESQPTAGPSCTGHNIACADTCTANCKEGEVARCNNGQYSCVGSFSNCICQLHPSCACDPAK